MKERQPKKSPNKWCKCNHSIPATSRPIFSQSPSNGYLPRTHFPSVCWGNDGCMACSILLVNLGQLSQLWPPNFLLMPSPFPRENVGRRKPWDHTGTAEQQPEYWCATGTPQTQPQTGCYEGKHFHSSHTWYSILVWNGNIPLYSNWSHFDATSSCHAFQELTSLTLEWTEELLGRWIPWCMKSWMQLYSSTYSKNTHMLLLTQYNNSKYCSCAETIFFPKTSNWK